MLQNQVQLMKPTPDTIKLRICRFISKARHNTLELPHHGVCAIGAHPDHLHSPTRADDIKNALDEDEHVLASVMLIHWDGDEMKVV
jgi:hypothetical protein